MSASPERLRAAARIVRERGLAVAQFEDARGRVCTAGALRIASWGSVCFSPGSSAAEYLEDREALGAVVDISAGVFEWNDHPDRTAEEVAAAFEAAADRLEGAR